ncbi:MAG: lysophospholipid acyltransferase family protein [Gemmatimonadota bacterium]|nr:lysophospholipid acyltransferase family protein [Gemmatimonadota bacterium]
MLRLAASGFVWIVWLVVTALWTIPVAVVYALTVWWDERRWWVGRTFRWGARALVGVNPFWSVKIVGDLPDRETEPFVAVCNHESLADILLVGTLPFDMKWLSKAEIARIPFLGWMMKMAGDVLVRRSDRRSRGRSYDELLEWLRRGASVMLFPEGTRSRSGEMLPFRSGAFRLAVETGRPIQPLAVSGTREAIRADSALFSRARVTVRILEQVPTAGLTMDDVDELTARVRRMIARARADDLPPGSGSAGSVAGEDAGGA